MPTPDFDVIIVGSGPAGVSAAFPLIMSGLKVLMVDGGESASVALPSLPFLQSRSEDKNQSKWMLGEDFYALRALQAASPKLRVPTNNYVFSNHLYSHGKISNFVAISSLATGGLSNAWGAGVACLSDQELAEFPFPISDIRQSYETVVRRIGVSGANDDDLSGYFGLDEWAAPPIDMDELHDYIYNNYKLNQDTLVSRGFHLGRSRVAVLSRDYNERKACSLSGNCLFGCSGKSIYSSAYEITSLLKYDNFFFQSGFVVDKIQKNDECLVIKGKYKKEYTIFTGKKIVLAAGTLPTTKLALSALQIDRSVNVLSCPTAAFLLWLPKMLGAKRSDTFGLGQISFKQKISNELFAFGSMFSTLGIPVSEFARYLPLHVRYGVDLLNELLSSCLIGNVFLPGGISTSTISLNSKNGLNIDGRYGTQISQLWLKASRKLRRSFWKISTILLPGSFTIGQPGNDIHYAGTFPMHHHPILGETNAKGEMFGMLGVYIVDGACLPTLTEKPHTLTIMANADRIGRELAIEMNKK